MTTSTALPQVEKQCFRNESPGWIGAVAIGPKGEDRGIAIAPGDTVWLSEAEQILTANAPRLAEDNPFIEQEMTFGVDDNGERITKVVTPLLPITENRYVPAGDRPIPSIQAEAEEEVEPDPEAVARREAEILADPEEAQPRVHPRVPPAAAAAVEAANEAKVEAQPTPPAEEEHAAAVPPEEFAETGAAVQPSEDAPEGEFAMHEEVGTPKAPAPYVPPVEG